MKIGYIRVSAEEQNTARQETIMQDLGAEKLYIEKISGKDTNRPELKAMLEFAREGDTIVVESYSRLARSTRDLLSIIDRLKEKGIHFISHKENFDTTTPSGKLMLTMFAGISEFERDCLLERQKEGINEAKKAGKYKGRQPIEVDKKKFKATYDEWKAGKITAVQAYNRLNLKANTFYRRVKEYESTEVRKI